VAEADIPVDLPAARSEAAALTAVLERNRRTFAWKTEGLSRESMRRITAASTMTLGGLVTHLALVEADWLAVKLAGQPYGPPEYARHTGYADILRKAVDGRVGEGAPSDFSF
jgi:hypothetical protein